KTSATHAATSAAASAESLANGYLRGSASRARTRSIGLTVTRPLDECICRTADAKIRRAADDVGLPALYARCMSRSDRALDRVGAVAGIAAVVLFVAAINVTPTLPSPNHGLEAIARSAQDNSDGYLRAIYLGALLTGALLVFGSAV